MIGRGNGAGRLPCASRFITSVTNCVSPSTITVPPPLNRLITVRSSLCAASTSNRACGLPEMPSTTAGDFAPSFTTQ